MSFEIKICGITSEDAVRAAADAGATAVGFVLSASPRRVDIGRAAHLAGLVPPGIARVAVFRHPSAALVKAVLRQVPVDRVQTDAFDHAAIRHALGSVSFIPVYRDSDHLARDIAAGDRAGLNSGRILVEGPISGAGVTPDWGRIRTICRRTITLAGGLTSDNVERAIAIVNPTGVDTSSGVESSPGVKDPARIEAFVRAARKGFEALLRGEAVTA